MAFLYNTQAGRELQEGDIVRILSGPRNGREGTVVGFDLVAEHPIVVQYDNQSGILHETFTANEVEVKHTAPESLEPLPEIRTILKDAIKAGEVLKPNGRCLVLSLSDGGYLSFVPKGCLDLRRICESQKHKTYKDQFLGLLRKSFVTRLPHLVRL